MMYHGVSCEVCSAAETKDVNKYVIIITIIIIVIIIIVTITITLTIIITVVIIAKQESNKIIKCCEINVWLIE